jgi:hypothetical protein
MKLLYRESVTLALLFSALALYLAAVLPSVFHNLLVVVGLMHVFALLIVTNTNRLQ